MKQIELTQGQFAIVDDEDYEELNKHKWCALWAKSTNSFYAGRSANTGTIYMHRIIVKAGVGQQVDHINHDTLDNRKENLRICTRQQNQRNRKPNKDGSSLHKGVYWHKQHNKWSARIGINSKDKHLGYFKTEQDAAQAYNDAAKEYYGEFAYIDNICD